MHLNAAPYSLIIGFGTRPLLCPNSYDPFKIVSFEFKYLLLDLWYAPGLWQKIVVLSGKPGETYDYAKVKQKAGVQSPEPVMMAAE